MRTECGAEGRVGREIARQSRVELTIRVLRRRLQVALEQDASRAIIDALRETLQMFETGRIPRRYDYRGSSVKRR